MYLLWVVQDSLNLQKKVSDGDRHKEEDDGLINGEVLIAFMCFIKLINVVLLPSQFVWPT